MTKRRFGIGVLIIAFILGVFVIFESWRIANMDYSEYGIPLWKGSWQDVPERYRIYLTLKGILTMEEFPVPWFGPAPVETPPPRYADVGVLEVLYPSNENTPKKVYFWTGGKTNMVLEFEGPLKLGSVTLSNWTTAFNERRIIEVEGYAFDVIQEGNRYTLFHVENQNLSRQDVSQVHVPAWVIGGRVGGGSGFRIEVNESDLLQFPHLIKAFKEKEKAQNQRLAHALSMTYCPAEEAMDIIEFFGRRYSENIDSYSFKIILEDGRLYSFYIVFAWEPPPL